ncbi:hypothetical protein C8A01DRAFT_35647 [Parachaetomium inaequale]|uniref:Uncharacterized protein n=1 Tax=Parachaetomium inaequale TaxID=2588326 RepID=A0AAN6PGQ2_9PEZI|nr:hypothetical protein C8A01DRAFT_35647 [Parachaetomium inaequale]
MATVKLRLKNYAFRLPTGGDSDDDDYDAWAASFNSALTKLAATLRRCSRMRSLDVEVRVGGLLDHQAYLMAEPVADLLSVGRLTSLTFDSATCLFSRTPESGVHFCRSINALLPSLRRLRFRMESVCKSLLEPPPGDAPLALEEVIVNLSLSQLNHAITSVRHSRCCGDVAGTAFVQFKNALEAQATALAARLRQPRMVRIITHEFPSLDFYAFDALTGKRILLEDNIEWDAEGEAEDDAEADATEDDESDLFADEPPVTPFIVL